MDPLPPSDQTDTSRPEEKQPWTAPVLKKMDIEETAIGLAQKIDGDGAS